MPEQSGKCRAITRISDASDKFGKGAVVLSVH